MTATRTLLQVLVYEGPRLRHRDEFDGPVELGRQREGEGGPYTRSREADKWRLVIARREENTLARTHALFEPLPGGKVRVSNTSTTQPIRLHDHADLTAGASCELPLPVVAVLGPKVVHVHDPAAGLKTLLAATSPPRAAPPSSARFPTLVGDASARIAPQELLGWLHTAVDVLQAAADSPDFFDRAARAVVEMIELDIGQVLLLEEDQWRRAAQQCSPRWEAMPAVSPSRRILQKVREGRRTYWEQPARADGGAPPSLDGIEAVVAAPILNRRGEVIGALYGERRAPLPGGPAALTEVEAMLVELLARGVAAGLARLEHERAALAERVRFEQFFTPALARQLARHPDWLQGREAEVTVLFCDIRGFSRVSERLGAARTFEWCRDVLDMLSGCVLAQGGVLVDYVGDGLLALWGAPEAQPDHARRACAAALEMLAQLPALNARWREAVGEAVGLGIGVNTGPAQVGNTGSQYKFKYGPHGHTVNVASRVEGATKYLKCPLAVTGSTRAQFGDGFPGRRLGRVRLANLAEAVELYELAPAGRPDWAEAKAEYEKALELFERREFGQAARTLGNWRVRNTGDGPALVLLYRAVKCLVEEAPASHPVWVLGEK